MPKPPRRAWHADEARRGDKHAVAVIVAQNQTLCWLFAYIILWCNVIFPSVCCERLSAASCWYYILAGWPPETTKYQTM
eukprot:scaffold421254_cov15-Prasinocladus_malaysianus.AAC.1